jgi:hypothetical protein
VKSLLAIACVACSSSPTTPPIDASTTFTFSANYTVDSTVTSVVVGGSSYSAGDTILLQPTYPSYEAAEGSAITMTVTAGSDTGSATITPDCPVSCGGDLVAATLSATVSWQGQPVITVNYGHCVRVGGSGCGFTD